MTREVIKEARNVDEAIDLACKEMGVEREETEFEILTLPKRGFLGLKNTLAKVRVYMEVPEPAPEPKPAEKKANAEKIEKPHTSKPEPKAEPQQIKQDIAVQEALQQKPKEEPKEQKVRQVEEQNEGPKEAPVFVAMDTLEGKAKTAAEYLKNVLHEIGLNVEIAAAKTESGILLRLAGDGLGVIIGRRGETLDALQYLCGLAANREEGDYMRVTIDSNNYREKREKTLQQLAQKLSASAIRFGRSSALEPMNPYERRIIHATVSKIEGVTSSSIGEEPNRRVVISPTNPRPQQGRGGRPGRPGGNGRPPRKNDRRFSDDRSGGRFHDRPPRRDNRDHRDQNAEQTRPTPTEVDRMYAKELEQQAVPHAKTEPEKTVRENTAPVREKTPEEGKDLPLYGKIEL